MMFPLLEPRPAVDIIQQFNAEVHSASWGHQTLVHLSDFANCSHGGGPGTGSCEAWESW